MATYSYRHRKVNLHPFVSRRVFFSPRQYHLFVQQKENIAAKFGDGHPLLVSRQVKS
jgi:hypothetical protein